MKINELGARSASPVGQRQSQLYDGGAGVSDRSDLVTAKIVWGRFQIRYGRLKLSNGCDYPWMEFLRLRRLRYRNISADAAEQQYASQNERILLHDWLSLRVTFAILILAI
jgi:hypothetical protein